MTITFELLSIDPGTNDVAGEAMLQQERWEQVRRLHLEERRSVSAIARDLDLDRKTVRRCLREPVGRPYRRAPRQGTLLAEHADFLRERAPQVCQRRSNFPHFRRSKFPQVGR